MQATATDQHIKGLKTGFPHLALALAAAAVRFIIPNNYSLTN